MIRIVGRKIIVQRGDSGAFRVILRDQRGEEVALSESDRITLNMKYKMESDVSLSKSAIAINIYNEGEIPSLYHIVQFDSEDTINLPPGDYYYEVILERDRRRFTIVPKSILTLEDSLSLGNIGDTREEGLLILEDDESPDYHSIISDTPLVGNFNTKSYTRSDVGNVDSDLIIF